MIVALVLAAPLSVGASVLVGTGASGLDAENAAMTRSQRIGPELTMERFSGAMTLGVGVGYQSAYYFDEGSKIQRHDASVRGFARYHFGLGGDVEQVIGAGLWYQASFAGSDRSLYENNYQYSSWTSPKSTLSLFISYGPSFLVSARNRLTFEVGILGSPALTGGAGRGNGSEHLGLFGGVGWEYRAFDP